MSEPSNVNVTSTVELPSAVVDKIAAKVSDDVASDTVRDYCFEHLDRDTEFVTPGGQPVESAVRQR
jgi:hypothetical protein